MSREWKIFIAIMAGIAASLLAATPDPEVPNGEPITNPVALVAIFVAVTIGVLRGIRKFELMNKEDWME